MDDKRWDKLAAGTGIAFVALLLASAFVVPKTPPKIDDSINTIGKFYFDHHSGLVWGGWLGLLAILVGALGTLFAFLPVAFSRVPSLRELPDAA